MKLYIGNLSPEINDQTLGELFTPYGKPDSATVVTERGSTQSRGFAFVELSNDKEARAAIAGLNGKELGGRSLVVNEAKARR